MRLIQYFSFISILLCLVNYTTSDKKDAALDFYDTPLDERQLGPIGLTVLGALTIPIMIPVAVARIVSRLSNLGNRTSSAVGVTIRPVILPGRPFRRPFFGNNDKKRKRR